MNTNQSALRLAAVAFTLALLSLPVTSSASITNGDFTNSLDGWFVIEGNGNGYWSAGEAVLYAGFGFDTVNHSVSLMQGDDGSLTFPAPLLVPLDATTLRFDFRFEDIDVDPTESGDSLFGDALFVTVLDKLDFRLDVAAFVAEVITPDGPFSLDVSHLAGREVAIVFDLLDENDGRLSIVHLDNVAFVPVPAAGWLIVGGLLPLVLRRRGNTVISIIPTNTAS